MQNLELLHVDDGVREALQKSYQNYLRNAKIKMDILAVEGDVVTVRVEQFRKTTDKVLSAKELIERAKEVFEPVKAYTFRFRPLIFKGEGVSAVSAEYVRNQLKKYKLTQKDLCEAFGVDKHVMSKLLSGQYAFTLWHQSAFYYYFKSLKSD